MRRPAPRRPNAKRSGVAIVVLLAAAGCAKSGQTQADDPARTATKRPTEIVHEECDVAASGTERIDANGDGRADVMLVRDAGREVCRAVDFNFDGKVDVWVYWDQNGQVRRRESDYDRDGRIDEISVYQGGVLVERHSSTSFANRLDTWQFYESSVLKRAERDSNGDRVVDQWWEYPTPDCPLMHSDVTGDGRPDLGASVDYCKETGYVPPGRADAARPASPDFTERTEMPTEVDSKPMDAPDPKAPPADAAGGDAQ